MIPRFLAYLKTNKEKAQSFVELSLVLPIILLILLGLVEVSFFISRYLDVMDLTREAARFASIRDPEISVAWISNLYDCQNATPFNFYYHTACIFSPPAGSAQCPPASRYCNGLNPLVYLDPAFDDVVIGVFAVEGPAVAGVPPVIVKAYPNDPAYPGAAGFWAFSNYDEVDPVHNGNWEKDCQGNLIVNHDALGNVIPNVPHYTPATVADEMVTGSPMNKGYVGVEFYYCYHQVLNIPIANWVVPDPLRIHAYTIMPNPAAQPTPTP
jgi:hypothetical protein